MKAGYTILRFTGPKTDIELECNSIWEAYGFILSTTISKLLFLVDTIHLTSYIGEEVTIDFSVDIRHLTMAGIFQEITNKVYENQNFKDLFPYYKNNIPKTDYYHPAQILPVMPDKIYSEYAKEYELHIWIDDLLDDKPKV